MSNGRKPNRGQVNVVVQMVVFILAIGLLALLAARQIDRIMNPRRAGAVLTESLAAGSMVKPEQVAMGSFKSGEVAGTLLDDPGEVTGRTLVRAKKAGEPLYPGDFSQSSGGGGPMLSSLVPEGRVVTTLTLTNLTVPYKELRSGDRVDILVGSAGADRKRTSVVMVRDAQVLGYLAPPPARRENGKGLLGMLSGSGGEGKTKVPPGLMLAVKPTDVPALAEIQGSGAPLTLALHARKAVEEGKQLLVGRNPEARTVEVITGSKRETVKVMP